MPDVAVRTSASGLMVEVPLPDPIRQTSAEGLMVEVFPLRTGRVTQQFAVVIYDAGALARSRVTQQFAVIIHDVIYINSLTPNVGLVGTAVTIAGGGFGVTEGTVKFNNVTATVTNWADTEITCTVPEGATTGNVVVTHSAGYSSSGTLFTVDSATVTPSIDSIIPASAPVGDNVTINGSNFIASQGSGAVQFGSVHANIISWSDTQIVCTVPSVESGAVVVTVTNNDVQSDTIAFIVEDVVTPPDPIYPVVRAFVIGEGDANTYVGSPIYRAVMIGSGDADAYPGTPIVRAFKIGSGPKRIYAGQPIVNVYVIGEGTVEGYSGHDIARIFEVTD
jgi:hypothetical protein